MRGTRYIDLHGCARCHGGPHLALEFREFTHPIRADDGSDYTHFATCPTVEEPVLLRIVGIEETL